MIVFLSGGGIKCAYQIIVLRALRASVSKIVGISFGAIMGYFACLGLYDEAISFCRSIDGRGPDPCLRVFGIEKYLQKIPIIRVIYNACWILKSMSVKGLFVPDYGHMCLMNIHRIHKHNENLKTLNVIVFNTTLNKKETISGTHPLLVDYIIASCALWAIFPPVSIRRLRGECVCGEQCRDCVDEVYCNCDNKSHKYNEYVDAGFLYYIPYDKKLTTQSSSNQLILLGSDINNITKLQTGNNLVEYLHNLINYISDKYMERRLIEWKQEWSCSGNTYVVNYEVTSSSAISTGNIDRILKFGEHISKQISMDISQFRCF